METEGVVLTSRPARGEKHAGRVLLLVESGHHDFVRTCSPGQGRGEEAQALAEDAGFLPRHAEGECDRPSGPVLAQMEDAGRSPEGIGGDERHSGAPVIRRRVGSTGRSRTARFPPRRISFRRRKARSRGRSVSSSGRSQVVEPRRCQEPFDGIPYLDAICSRGPVPEGPPRLSEKPLPDPTPSTARPRPGC